MIGGNTMFVCLDCGHTFSEAKHYIEQHGLDTPPYEEYDGCPYCGGAYTETHRCECCDEWIDGSYIKLDSGERICENCYIAYDLGEE
jgi:hypothetical protein